MNIDVLKTPFLLIIYSSIFSYKEIDTGMYIKQSCLAILIECMMYSLKINFCRIGLRGWGWGQLAGDEQAM